MRAQEIFTGRHHKTPELPALVANPRIEVSNEGAQPISVQIGCRMREKREFKCQHVHLEETERGGGVQIVAALPLAEGKVID